MSTAASALLDRVEDARPAQARLFSLDLFRGLTIAAMIVVNNQSSVQAYWPLRHAEWNGLTPADLIFPFFLFIAGVSLVFSFRSRCSRGESRRTLILHTLWRSTLLFAIGLALNAMAALQTGSWRIPGVLQRIAVVYCAAALLLLFTETRGRVLWLAGLTLGYWAAMRYVPVPGYGVPGVDIPLLHPDGNLAAHIDRQLMLGHLWQTTRDPEGILSTLPAIATALCGVLTGEWLRSTRASGQKMTGMLAAGLAGIMIGELWGRWFPINKNLWTSSYVFLTAGVALLCLAACYGVTDVRLQRGRWTRPFLVLGTNAITGYVLSEVLGGWLAWKGARLFHWLTEIPSAALASLLHSLIILGLCFVPVGLMYRKKIFVKV